MLSTVGETVRQIGERLEGALVALQLVDRSAQRAGALDRLAHARRLAAQMLAEQLSAQLADRLAHVVATLRLDRQVALGVQAHRAVGEIRRADAHDLVVDDDELGMHVDARAALQSRR